MKRTHQVTFNPLARNLRHRLDENPPPRSLVSDQPTLPAAISVHSIDLQAMTLVAARLNVGDRRNFRLVNRAFRSSGATACQAITLVLPSELPTALQAFRTASIRRITLTNGNFKDVDLGLLQTGLGRSARLLKQLNLSNNAQITHAGIGALACMTALEQLDLGNCTGIGDAAMEILGRMTSLKELTLQNSPITNE